MKNPRIVKNKTLEVDFGPLIGPSEEIDPNNPFMRKKDESIITIRECKKCGKRFTLGVPYDPDDSGHDLCEDCLLKRSGTQEYPDTTTQIEQTQLDAVPTEYEEDYQEIEKFEE